LQGRTSGWRPLARALKGRVPVGLVRSSLRALKAERRREQRAARASRRTSTTVHARDALWSRDGLHLAHAREGKLEASLVRDVASTRTLAVSVGGAATAASVVALLEQAREERGILPLAVALDNGPENTAREVAAYLERERVVPLFNLRATPEHNSWIERGMRDYRGEADLPARVPRSLPRVARPPAATVLHAAARELDRARRTLDEHRLRASRGWRTALAVDAALPPWYAFVSRENFHAMACRAIAKAVQGCNTPRARRLAEREALFRTLERYGLVTRTRGGAPLPLVKPEEDSGPLQGPRRDATPSPGGCEVITGTTIMHDGSGTVPYYTPIIARGGAAALFSVDVTHIAGTPTLNIDVEHKNVEDTSWTTAGSFSSITAVGVESKDVTGLKEQIRLAFTFSAGSAGNFFVVVIAPPAFRLY